MKFMSADRHQIGFELRNGIEGFLADGLRGIRVKQDSALTANLPDLSDRLQRAGFVIRRHHRNQRRLRRDRRLHVVWVNDALRPDFQVSHPKSLVLFQILEAMQNRMMLDRAGDKMLPFAGARPQARGAKNRQIIALGPAAGENHFARLRAKNRRHPIARGVQRRPRLLPHVMNARRISVKTIQIRQHGGAHLRVQRRCRVVIEVNRPHAVSMRSNQVRRNPPEIVTRETEAHIERVADPTPKTLRLRLRPTAESIVRGGHPWVFADSIKEQNREGSADDLAVIFDRNDKFLAVGLYDPDSPIRVRILHAGKPAQIDSCFWRERFETALKKRAELFTSATTGYRCIHGENDGFPGLVLDRYGETFVLKLYTAPWLRRYREILPFITALPTCERVVLRLSRNLKSEDGQIIHGPSLESPVVFLENGLCFEADVLRGQKTGFFLDQRENRKHVESLAKNRDVLNAFSFSGGFSVYAARAGAKSVTDLDISAHALENSKRNFALNKLTTPHETIQADTFQFLAQKPSRAYGLIILDPPSLAKRDSEKPGALRAYRQLVQSALPWLSPDGIIVAASCSAHVPPDEFFAAILDLAPRRHLQELLRAESPSDHPATFPEARYLKCIYLAYRESRS
jgi:23S rRNA (cytosine1962-C5)-methyltransferase